MVRKLTTMAAKLFSIFGCYYIGLYMYVRVREIPILVFSKVDLWCERIICMSCVEVSNRSRIKQQWGVQGILPNNSTNF